MKKHIYQLALMAFDAAKKHVANKSSPAIVQILVNPNSREALQLSLLDLYDIHYSLRPTNPTDTLHRKFNDVISHSKSAYNILFELYSNEQDPNIHRFGNYHVEGYTHLFVDFDFPKAIKRPVIEKGV